MKLLKLLFVFGLLHKSTIVTGQNAANKSVRVSLVKTLQSNRSEGCKCNDQPWKEGVDRFLKGIQEANANLCGTPLDRTKPINALLDYQTQLTSFTTSDSSILASSSTEILNSLSKCSKLGGSGRNIIVQFKNVFAAIVADFNKIARKLSDHIAGDLICAFTDAVRDLSRVFLNYMTEVLYSSKKEIDNKSVLERLQNILNIVAHIGQTVDNCNSTKESQAGVTVLNWLSFFLENAVQGIGSCALEVQHHRRIQITTTIKKCDSCKCTSNKEPWKQQIDRFFKGIQEANDKLRGTPLDRTKPIDFLQDYVTKLTSFTTSDSSILASSSTEILNAISQCGKVGGSGRNIIVQFKNVFPAIVEAVNEIARKLTDHIASDLIVAFTDAVSDFGCAFSNYMTEILESQSFGRKKEVDFEPVLQRLQNILNIVAHIGQTVNNGNATQESQTAALVLNLITLFLGNAVEGIGACALEVQQQQSHLSQSCRSYSLSLNKALLLILKAVEAVVASLGVTVTEVLNVVTNVVSDLNSLFQNVFGLLNGVGSITKNLLKIF